MRYHLQDRLDHVGNRFNNINGETVVLSRGSDETPNVRVSAILKQAEEVIPGLSVTRVEYQDFACDADHYIIAGSIVSPQAGDKITRRDGSVFKLVSGGPNEPPYRYLTSSRRRYLLHTEMVKRPEYRQDYPET